jgi:F-type H+-transporting ATPase subunit b
MGQRLIQPDVATILWTVITFAILAVLLARFGWRPLLQALEERERAVRESVEQAQKARAEAEETLRRNQEILAGARRETAVIIEQGKREAETLRAEILAQAKREAQDLVEQGKKQIQHEQKQALEELRRQVADLAIQAAERLIARSLDDRKHRDLLDEYVKNLGALSAEESRR